MTPLRIYILCLMLTVSAVMRAQFSWDWAGVESLIDDHKGERSVLITRSVLEQGNKLLHSYSDNANGKYKDINVELDNYTKAFDVIDLVFTTVSTGFNVYKTVNDVSDKVSKYRTLLTDFSQKVVARGRMEPADTLILTINEAAVNDLYSECQNLYSSVLAIAAYSSGQMLANVSCINMQITRIDECLTRIQRIIDTAYFHTLTYIRSRLTFWNRKIFTKHSKHTIANDAFGRWRLRGQEVKSKG